MIDKLIGFKDSDGLVTPNPHPGTSPNGSGNGVLYTSLAVIGRYLNDTLTDDHIEEYAKVMRSCQMDMGLLKRGPHHPDQQAMDDYIGYAVAQYAIGYSHKVSHLIIHGESSYFRPLPFIKLNYFFNNVNPPSSRFPDNRLNFNAWIGRYPGIRGLFKYSARLKPTFLERVGFAASLRFAARAKETDQDGWLMGLLQWLVADLEDPIVGPAANAWMAAFKSKKKGYVRGVISNVVCPGHPLPELFPNFLNG